MTNPTSQPLAPTQSETPRSALSARVEASIAPGPRCRDCADSDGRCPGSGELCDPSEKAKELADLVGALERELAAVTKERDEMEARAVSLAQCAPLSMLCGDIRRFKESYVSDLAKERARREAAEEDSKRLDWLDREHVGATLPMMRLSVKKRYERNSSEWANTFRSARQEIDEARVIDTAQQSAALPTDETGSGG